MVTIRTTSSFCATPDLNENNKDLVAVASPLTPRTLTQRGFSVGTTTRPARLSPAIVRDPSVNQRRQECLFALRVAKASRRGKQAVQLARHRWDSFLTLRLPFVIVSERMSISQAPAARVQGLVEVRSDANASPSSEPAPSDELLAIARAAAQGDSEAAATLLLQLGGGMLRVVRRVYGANHPDLDDITQEATIAVLAALPYFRGESSVTHFAYRVTLLTALGALRKTRAQMRKAQEEATPLVDVPDPLESPYSNAVSHRRRELVRELLNELSEPVAQALGLHFMLGQPVEEIAEALGVSPHTVWSRLRLGKQALRRKLQRNADLRELLEGQE